MKTLNYNLKIKGCKYSIYFLFLYCIIAVSAQAQEQLGIKKVASNLGGVVWGMSFLNDNELLIGLKNGTVKKVNLKRQKVQTITHIDVLNEGQAGLLDIVLSKNFKNDGTVYFTYVKNINGQGATTLAKAEFFNNQWKNQEDILVTQSTTNTSRHFGSRIAFDDQGDIFFTIGDRGVRDNAQNLKNHAGTVVRLKLDGSTPSSNPFVNTEALDEIYSYGHRNPQGLFFDEKLKKLFLVEHGPRGGDEINIIQKGANYGWPIISYGKEYWNPLPVGEGTHKKGMEQPIKVYIPSIAPSNLVVYRGEEYPFLKDKIIVGALKLQHINVISLNKNLQAVKETRLFEDLGERIRCITISENQLIYFSTDSGNIYKIITY